MGASVSNYAIYSRNYYGMQLMDFSLEMALAPGMSENTVQRQLAKALTYWQNVQSTTTDGNLRSRATTAIGWIQTEQARVQNPPANSLHIVYPV